jgi:Zinc carboxypeptidase/Cytosolic carboxypeptidase N-terminal domain
MAVRFWTRSFALGILAGAFYPLHAQIGVVTNFEGGNVGKVVSISPNHLRCAVQGQSDREHRNRQADWYYFELTNLPRAPVTIDLVDLAGEYDYRSPAFSVTKGTRPVYSYDRVGWQHFRDDQVEWDDKEPHLSLRFTAERDHVWIAHVPPYTNKDLAALLDTHGSSRYLKTRVAGRTVEGRNMLLLTITNPKIAEAKKKVIWLMFRQHAWETGSSWAAEGAIRFLLSNAADAALLRDQAIFHIFPMADPDGVATGGVRYNKNGYDLNRNWDTVDAEKMPEIAAQRGAILDWVDTGHRLDLFLSVHNTETGEYLQAPPDFRALGQRVLQLLTERTTFHATTALRDTGEVPTAGRMTVAQGLFHDRKLPAMLMEQMIEYNSKLGRCPTMMDRMEFGAGLVRALVAAVAPR